MALSHGQMKHFYAVRHANMKNWHAFGKLVRQVEQLAHHWHGGKFIDMLARKNEKLVNAWHVGMWAHRLRWHA